MCISLFIKVELHLLQPVANLCLLLCISLNNKVEEIRAQVPHTAAPPEQMEIKRLAQGLRGTKKCQGHNSRWDPPLYLTIGFLLPLWQDYGNKYQCKSCVKYK